MAPPTNCGDIQARFMKLPFALLLAIAVSGCSGGTPNLPTGSGKSLRLEIYDSHGENRTVASFDVVEPSRVNAVLAVLRQGTRQDDHKCAEIGAAAIAFANGQTVTVDILPGHKVENYEFRYQRHNYWVPRNDLFSALRNAGVDIAAIPKAP